MEKTFCDYCGEEIQEIEIEVPVPPNAYSAEDLASAREDMEEPEWEPIANVSLETYESAEERHDCCAGCLAKFLLAAKAKAEAEPR